MIKVTFPSFNIFNSIVKAVAPISDYLPIIPEEDGISIRVIDEPRVVALFATINEKDLTNYEVDSDLLKKDDQDRAMLVIIKDLKRLMTKAKKDDTVTLELLDDGRLKVTIEGRYKISGKMNLADDSNFIVPNKVDLPFQSTMIVYGKLLKDMVSMAKGITDEFMFEVEEDALRFHFEGLNVDSDIRVPWDDDLIKEVEAEPGAKGIYGTSYLLDIVKSLDNSDLVTVEWGWEMPMRISKDILGNSRMEYYIAPRVGEE